MKISELNQYLKNGYKVEDLTSEEKMMIRGMLLIYEEIQINPTEYAETILGQIRKEVAEETIDELRGEIVLTIADHVVSMIDEHEESILWKSKKDKSIITTTDIYRYLDRNYKTPKLLEKQMMKGIDYVQKHN